MQLQLPLVRPRLRPGGPLTTMICQYHGNRTPLAPFGVIGIFPQIFPLIYIYLCYYPALDLQKVSRETVPGGTAMRGI